MALRLLLVIDVRLYREGLAAALGGQSKYTVVGAVGSCAAARTLVRSVAPDVVVLDMAVRDALELIRELRHEHTDVAVVAFAVDETTADIIRCAEAGASSYVTADASIDELSAAIEGAISGELLCTPRLAGELFRRLGRPRAARVDPAHPLLTARERQVLEYLRCGLSNKEIGQKLCLAESTIKNHVHHLLDKLGVRTRAQAAARALSGRQLSSRAGSR